MPGGRKPTPPQPVEDPDPGDITVHVEVDAEHEWRMLMLTGDCGLEEFAAFRLSVNGCDWHDVQRLVRGGATQQQILEILLP